MIKHIQVGKDRSCEMAIVLVDGDCVMEGNYWDFHPGCHGIDAYGDFRGVDDLVKKVKRKLLSDGHDVVVDTIQYKYGTSVEPIQTIENQKPTKKLIKQCLTNDQSDKPREA